MCARVCACVCVHVCVRVCVHVCACTCACMCLCVFVCACVHMYNVFSYLFFCLLCCQLIGALEFVHSMDVWDLCLHSGNILVWTCKPFSIKLSDKAVPTQPHSCKVRLCVCIHVCMYVYACTCVCLCMCLCVFVHVHTHTLFC